MSDDDDSDQYHSDVHSDEESPRKRPMPSSGSRNAQQQQPHRAQFDKHGRRITPAVRPPLQPQHNQNRGGKSLGFDGRNSNQHSSSHRGSSSGGGGGNNKQQPHSSQSRASQHNSGRNLSRQAESARNSPVQEDEYVQPEEVWACCDKVSCETLFIDCNHQVSRAQCSLCFAHCVCCVAVVLPRGIVFVSAANGANSPLAFVRRIFPPCGTVT
jgi:hypothetical protein